MITWMILLLFMNTSYAQGATQFSGISNSDQAWLQSEIKKKNDKLMPRDADRLVKELMKRSSYLNVKVFQDPKGQLIFQAQAQKNIRSVKFVGRKAVGEIEALNAVAIKPDTRLDQNKLIESAARLRELYGRSGYFNPVIKVNVPSEAGAEIDVLIEVTENDPCRIKAVQIETDNPALQRKLNAIAKSYRKDIFSEKKVQELEFELEEYLQKERFLSSRLLQKEATYNEEKTWATLVYKVEEPSSFTVRTQGNDYYSQADLLRAAELDDFDRTSLNPAAEIAERIRLKYINSGFANAKINFSFTAKKEDFSKTILVNIEEGRRVRIDDIIIAGRLSRSPEYYGDFIKDNSSEAIDDGYYVKDDIDLGLKNLLTELNNQGYLRAKIQAARPEYNKERSQIKLTIIMDEGPLTQIKDIRFSGNSNYTAQQLLKVLKLSPNSPLRLNQLEQGLEDLKDFYRSEGHIEMGIENERSELVRYDEKGYEAKIDIKIYEGPKVYIREILVEGNNFTKDYVIQKEVNIDPGEILTPEKIDEAQKRLDKLNIFSRVEIRTLEANTKVSKRTLVVTVTERNPGSFRIGMGITNERDFTVRGFTGISYSNLGGRARAISLRATAENNVAETDYTEYEVALGYLEPFLFDSRYRARFNLSREEEVAEFDSATELTTVDATNKFSTLIERDITSKIKFTWNLYTLERVERFYSPKRASNPDVERQTIATIGPLLDIDYRDNPFLPTKGFFSRIEADFSSPELASSDQINFVRTQATVSYYQPLFFKNLIWANSIRGGYGKNLIKNDPDSGIPDSYAFFLGGYTTIRGYSGTDDDKTPTDGELGIPPTGGDRLLIIPDETSYHLFKSEVRFPIYGVFGGVVFYDAGAVSVSGFDENRPQRLKRSYGLGFRINTPVGPISLDYGKKVKPEDGESPDHFHLSIGTF